MSNSYVDNLASRVKLSSILVHQQSEGGLKDHTPDLTITLSGPNVFLKIAAAKIQKVIRHHTTGESQDHIIHLSDPKIHSGKLEINIYELATDETPEKILELIHKATRCDIGASAEANVEINTTTNTEEKINYLPGVTIKISHKDAYTREIVEKYLRHQLHAEYDFKYKYAPITGSLGIAAEYFFTIGIKDVRSEMNDRIYLHFREKSTNDKKEAKMIANTAAEHICGQLGIPEITEHKLGSSKPNNESYRWN